MTGVQTCALPIFCGLLLTAFVAWYASGSEKIMSFVFSSQITFFGLIIAQLALVFVISDARMSGTAYGTVVLHVAPEAAAGGPLAAVQEGDWIELDCHSGRLHLDISDAELAARLADIDPPKNLLIGGYRQLYIDHVMQADQGCDFDFLVGCRGSEVPRHSH